MQSTYNTKQSNNGVCIILNSYSLLIPTLYLCRHCLELSIKRAIGRLGKQSKTTHGLERQWNAFTQYLPKQKISGKERSLLKNMFEFIKNIDKLDDNGTKLRYSTQTEGTLSQEKFMWVNSRVIVENTEKFVKQLDSLRYEEIINE